MNQESKTPRTDVAFEKFKKEGYRLVSVDFARQLEQELNTALDERDKLRKVCDALAYQVRAGIGTHGDQCINGDKCRFIIESNQALSHHSNLPHVKGK